MLTPQDLVAREVRYCVSALVSTLASNYGGYQSSKEVAEISEQAFELASPVESWEEALLENGWEQVNGGWKHMGDSGDEPLSMQDALDEAQLDEPYQWDVFEHWIVSDWLAGKLEARGEKVDKDFAGLTVWARTTTGQAIYADSVIEAICAELNA